MADVRSFPLGKAPKGGELDKLRADFVAFQFGYHAFSDHYAVVARFAWEKAQEAYRKGVEDAAKISEAHDTRGDTAEGIRKALLGSDK